MITYYVVQAYRAGKNGYPVPDEAREVPSERYAVALCDRLKAETVALVAFSRSGDQATGEWGDAEIIYRWGEVTDDLLAQDVA